MSRTIERIHSSFVPVSKTKDKKSGLKLRLDCKQKLDYPLDTSASIDGEDLEVVLDRNGLDLIISFFESFGLVFLTVLLTDTKILIKFLKCPWLTPHCETNVAFTVIGINALTGMASEVGIV